MRWISRALWLLVSLFAATVLLRAASAQDLPRPLYLPLVLRDTPRASGIVAHFGSLAEDLAVAAGHVFVTDGSSILVHRVDDASDLPVGSTAPLPGRIQRLVHHAGRLYALVRSDELGGGGLIVLSIEDPERPRVIGQLDGLADPRDIAIDGDLAYLADGVAGLKVVALGAARPTLLGQHRLVDPDDPFPGAADSATAASLAFGRLYLARDLGMELEVWVFDIDDPMAPRPSAQQRLRPDRFPRQPEFRLAEPAVFVLDQRAFVVDRVAPERLLALPFGAEPSLLVGDEAYALDVSQERATLRAFRLDRACLAPRPAGTTACERWVGQWPVPRAGYSWPRSRMAGDAGAIAALGPDRRWLLTTPDSDRPQGQGRIRRLPTLRGPAIESDGYLFSLHRYGPADDRLRISPAGWTPATADALAEIAVPADLELAAVGAGHVYLRGQEIVADGGRRFEATRLHRVDVRDPARPRLIDGSGLPPLDASALWLRPPFVYDVWANRRTRELELRAIDLRDPARSIEVDRLTIASEISGQRRLVHDGRHLAAVSIRDGRRIEVTVVEIAQDDPGQFGVESTAAVLTSDGPRWCCMNGPWGLAALDGRLYIGTHTGPGELGRYGLDGELITIDLRAPAGPRMIHHISLGQDAIKHLVPGQGLTELLASTSLGEIWRVDLRDPDRPRWSERLDRLPIDGFVRPHDVPRVLGASWAEGRLYLGLESPSSRESRGLVVVATD